MLKEFIYLFFCNVININLYLIKKFNKRRYVYSNKISFGDTFIFYIDNYFKVIKDKIKIIIFSKLEEDISRIFFTKKNIINIFFPIPRYVPVYRINVLLKKKKNFTSTASLEVDYSKRKLLNKHRMLLIKSLKKNMNLVSPEIKRLIDEKFILIFIKHYNNTNKNLNGSNARQTCNFHKVYKTINFLIKKKNKILILGDKFDKSVPILRAKYFNNNNVIFFSDVSSKKSIFDQLFVHYYSLLSIGSDSGTFMMSHYLKKKTIHFDAIKNSDESYQKLKNIKLLYKKIIYKNKIENLSQQAHLNNISNITNKFIIRETSFLEIKNQLKKINYNL
jgi:hypothetical protein